jgi:hypothetical protein
LTKKGDSEEKRMQVIWDELSKETVINFIIWNQFLLYRKLA